MNAGDLVFCHSQGTVARAIRLAESLGTARAGDNWNHVAVLSRPAKGDDWWVIQAEARGVTNTRRLSQMGRPSSYKVVACPSGLDPQCVVSFAESQVGNRYGFLTIASIVVTLLTPKFFSVRRPGSWVCSSLVAASLMFAGWLPSEKWPDIYQVTPADLYTELG